MTSIVVRCALSHHVPLRMLVANRHTILSSNLFPNNLAVYLFPLEKFLRSRHLVCASGRWTQSMHLCSRRMLRQPPDWRRQNTKDRHLPMDHTFGRFFLFVSMLSSAVKLNFIQYCQRCKDQEFTSGVGAKRTHSLRTIVYSDVL